MIGVTGAMIAGALAFASGSFSQGSTPPIHLQAEETSDGLHLQVLGSSQTPYEAVYTLEVLSGPDRQSRSLQRGRVVLAPDVPVRLITVRLGEAASTNWRARLSVEPADGPAYEEVRTASGTS